MFGRLAVIVTILVTLSLPASAQRMTEKEQCLQSIKDAKVNLTKTEDTGRPGEKIEQEAEKLFPIAERLCEEGNYKDAKELVAFLRHLLAD